jgi:hypothetical protein
MAKHRQKHLFPELDSIISAIQSDKHQDLVILFVPSHDKKQNQLSDQDLWAEAALNLVGELYRGGTAFDTYAGVYMMPDGTILKDKPITIETYVEREHLLDMAKLKRLLDFLKRTGRDTNQAAVGLVINHVFHEITRF